jgi:predicted site-specific integrase-resolvase
MERWIKPSEAATYFDIKGRTISEWCLRGIIPAWGRCRIGLRWRVKLSAVEQAIRKNKRKG